MINKSYIHIHLQNATFRNNEVGGNEPEYSCMYCMLYARRTFKQQFYGNPLFTSCSDHLRFQWNYLFRHEIHPILQPRSDLEPIRSECMKTQN